MLQVTEVLRSTCGSLLMPKKTEFGTWNACPNGHTQPALNQDQKILVSKNQDRGKNIEVMSGDNILAVHDHKCPKCGYEKAELREMSCSYSDEDNTYRMKCGKCGQVEQLEGKVR